MERVDIDAVENAVAPARTFKSLTGPLGATDLAVNYYELEPGGSFGYAYHAHEIQEEVFVVLSGEVTFHVGDDGLDAEDPHPTETVVVGADEAIRFGPGEFQRGVNEADEPATALALGAPLEYGACPKYRECPDCGEWTSHELTRVDDGDVVVAVCQACEGETERWTKG